MAEYLISGAKDFSFAPPSRNTGMRFMSVVFLLLCGIGLSAQPEPAEIFRFPLTAETRPRFIEVCAVLSKRKIVKGNFEQIKTINRLNRSLTSKGDFIIAADTGMVWETRTPFPSTLAMSKDQLIQSSPSGAKTRLNAAGNETFLRLADTISAVFSGNYQSLTEAFDAYFTESGGVWTLGLIPSEQAISSVASRIVISGDSVIRSILLYEQTGDAVRYTLSNHAFPKTLSPAEKKLFSF
ncbi:MAG: outer membrane lipoprotein carrier protein LolA [Spirochaetaceae bacterium]|jgi:outer membrane lipoprotein-sorting protein|nr:outer membrane lipoprotein carrier protein LolA [Spirochaetaceae bacterium]